MSISPHAVAQTAAPTPTPLPSTRRVARLLERVVRQKLTAQAGAAAVWLVAIVFVFVAGGVAAGGDSRESSTVIRGALGWFTWLAAGSIALAATGQATAEDEAVYGLAALRGVGPRSIAWARAWAVGRRVFTLLLVPALLVNLAVLPFVRSWAAAAAAVSVLCGSLGYLALLAAATGALVLAARSLAPERARWALAALLFLPELVRSLVAHFPSIPTALATARAYAVHIGGWA